MKNLISFFLIVSMLFSGYKSFAQCPGTPPLSFTFESTESRCESNGTVTLHITGGTPFTDINGFPIYNNTIIAPIVLPIGGQADSVFAALAADTYTIEVADANGCTVTHNVTVPGTHMQLELTPTWGPALCDGSSGGWICGTPAEGRPWPPGYYKYQLFDGSTNPPTPITPIGLDSCFTNLAAGEYEIRAFDSCNNFQTRDLILPIKTYNSTYYGRGGWKYLTCDSACVTMAPNNSTSSPPWGEYPYQWEVISAGPDVAEVIGETGQFDSGADFDTLCFTPLFTSDKITIRVTDVCGNMATRVLTLNTFGVTGTEDFDCTSGGILRAFSSDVNHCTSNVTYEITSGPPGFPLPPPQNTNTWDSLPPGSYCIKLTDCCGNVDTDCETIWTPDWVAEFDTIKQESCINGWVGFDVGYDGYYTPTGLEAIITSAPAGYPNSLPDTLSVYFADVIGPPGTYCVTLYDACGNRDSLCATITDTLSYQTDVEVVLGCITSNELNITFNGNIAMDYNLRKIAPNYSVIATNSSQVNWVNLTAGQYVVEWENDDGNCILQRDTIEIPEYEPPGITGAWGIECSNGTGLISVQGSGGRLPYTYELFQGPVTRPLQTSPDFPGLPIGTYDVRLNDFCNNSDIVTVSIEPFAPVIKGYGGSFCLGDTAFLYVDYFELATYAWSGPNGVTSDSSFIIIPNLTLADAGTYVIDIDIKNPDQSACIAQTLSVEVEVFDCVCAPGDFTVQNIDCFNSDNGSVTATMISNSGGPFTYQWSNGGNTQTINNLPPGTYAVTIIDAGGCVVTGDTTLIGAPKLNVTAGIENVSCTSGSDGEVILNTVGGVPGYTYQWGSGQMTSTITGLTPGTYSVSVTDVNGCCSAFSLMVGTENCSPCELAENNILDICAEITANPNHELATLDCDNGGIDNQTECDNGGNPMDPDDDCTIAIVSIADICQIISANPNSPLATKDCDGGGVINILECQNGGAPEVDADDCDLATFGNLDVCLIIGSDPSHPLAGLDCDLGGVDNYTECTNGGDPANPDDDCLVAVVAEMDICTIIAGGHPWATLDCDNGGIPNDVECMNGGNPADPIDDQNCPIEPCEAAMSNGTDICVELTLNPNSPLATLDCDNGGIDNQSECDNGGNPSDPADDCDMAIATLADICALISANPDILLANADCDFGGVSNIDECNNGGDPLMDVDDCDIAMFGALDLCLIIGSDPTHILAAQDCDLGGVDNYTECTNGGDPTTPNDDCQVAVVAGIDICTILASGNQPWGSLDCDNGGVSNEDECNSGMNPNDPSDDKNCVEDLCETALTNGTDICVEIANNPNSPLATLDCDNGGIDNQTECANGGDPNEPSDDCDMAILSGADICALIDTNPDILLADEDCDNGGVSNVDECDNGGDPNDEMDDCFSAIDAGLNICQLINYDPQHPLAILDCDFGGVTNWEECQNGGDPSEPSDDCAVAIDNDMDICNLLTVPNTTLGLLDCDEDGVINDTECLEGTDPADPCFFNPGSITEPVTADQSDCGNLCPDLTPITTILPGNIAGAASVGVAVEITELNSIDTDGSGILVRMPSDPRLTFIWDPVLTTVALTPVNNANWNYLGDNGVVHTFQYTGNGTIIAGGTTEAFGFESVYDPQNTDGQTTITASIVPFGGGECNILNDTDSERLVYFE